MLLKNMISLMLILFVTMSTSLEAQNITPDYTLWAKVLKSYVDDQGMVDYEALLANRSEFNAFIKQIEETNVDQLSAIEQKVFWINAYNAVTVKVILDNYPVKSIRHINFSLVWQVGRRVAGQKISLGDIEHKILRPLGDPRIHFAINCASIGCPKLAPEPFTPDRIDEQLDRETKRFINDPEKIRLDKEKGILYFSAILDWFEEDFLVADPDILSYIKRYIHDGAKEYLDKHNVKLKQLKYDWNLNKQ